MTTELSTQLYELIAGGTTVSDKEMGKWLRDNQTDVLAALSCTTSATDMTDELRTLEWRSDMENAPRDGTWVLCWGPDCLHGIARFYPNPIWAEYPEYTHWMPLPSPPSRTPRNDG